MSNKPHTLQLSDPAVRAAMSDLPTMQRWEVLRRSGAAMSALELAAACDISHGEAIRSLDLLLDGGFVVRIMATARNRHATYRVISDETLVTWDPQCPEQRNCVTARRDEVRRYTRDAVEAHYANSKVPSVGLRRFLTRCRTPVLTQPQAEKIAAILQSAFDAISEIENEANARSRAALSGGTPSPEPSDDTQYLVALTFGAVNQRMLPLPKIALIEAALAARRRESLASHPRLLLTPRELEVAERLATGESRPQAAKALGVTPNTLATVSKRIYAKLGVHNRAEFTARMAAHLATAPRAPKAAPRATGPARPSQPLALTQ